MKTTTENTNNATIHVRSKLPAAKTITKACLILSTFASIASSCSGGTTNETPAYDETNPYIEVRIGEQVWMAENLSVETFRNGDSIPQAQSNAKWEEARIKGQPARCYYENNEIQSDLVNGEKFGKLYNWHAVNDQRGLAPEGWHIPSDDEWTILTDYLGGEDSAGIKIKSCSGWEENGNGTNESGFTGLPGGLRYVAGYFSLIGKYGLWWSSTESNIDYVWIRTLYYLDSTVDRKYIEKEFGL